MQFQLKLQAKFTDAKQTQTSQQST